MKPVRVLCALIILLMLSGMAQLQDNVITYFVSTEGSDDNDGLSEETAFRTVTQAWNMLPMGEDLTQEIEILIMSGTYTPEELPNYWESRYGTSLAPVTIKALRPNSVYLPSINMYDSRFINFVSLNIVFADGMPFHCEKCVQVSLIGNTIRGDEPGGNVRETVKFNQSQYITLNYNDISGADDNAIDFVAVQYAHISHNKIHDAGDWCMYTKGGSAYITIELNEIYDCGTGGFTAGQGTGFQFMTPPWLQYEAYAIWFKQNSVHDTFGAGVGVNGGYDIVITGNIFERVGERSHVIEVVYGLRSCDGQPGDEGRERCLEYRDMGGWGNDLPEDGVQAVQIPNKNILILNNVISNPAPFQSADQHFTIASPYDGPLQENSNLGAVVADENLRIWGNTIWNGDDLMLLGIEAGDFDAGCQSDNPTCNEAQIRDDNLINGIEPILQSVPKLVESEFTILNYADLLVELPAPFGDAEALNMLPAWDVPVPPPNPAWFAYPIAP